MKPTHLLAALLALAALSVDLVVASRLRTAPDAALMLLCGGGCGQLALLAAWCVWGDTAWLLRLLSVLAAAALLSVPLAAATAGQWSEWFLVLCLFAGLVAAPLLAARWSGLSVMASDADGLAERRGGLHRRQYSLGGLLSLMTAVGVCCGLRNYVEFPWPHAGALASYGICLTCVALAALWAMTSCGRSGLRIAALTLLCLVAGLVMTRTEIARSAWFFTMAALVEAVVVCLGLNVWLLGGWHLAWSRARP